MFFPNDGVVTFGMAVMTHENCRGRKPIQHVDGDSGVG